MPRERGETKRMSITGIDGSGKSSVAKDIIGLFGSRVPVASVGSLGSPVYITGPSNEKTPLFSSLSRDCKRMYDIGQEQDRDVLVLLATLMHTLISYRFAEPKAEKMGAQLIVRDRDPFVDPAVILSGYDRDKIPLGVLLTAIALIANPRKTNLLIYLDTPVDVALQRLSGRATHDKHESPDRMRRASLLYPRTIERVSASGFLEKSIVLNNNGDQSLNEVSAKAAAHTRQHFPRMLQR